MPSDGTRGVPTYNEPSMLDTAQLRDAFDETRRRLQTRGPEVNTVLDRLQSLDRDRRDLLPRVENLKAERNRIGESIARAK